jgi:5,10-methylene-tetrahydrofolate dehydrogenase/methenyl tetrahydrofolate cyclohydrolase
LLVVGVVHWIERTELVSGETCVTVGRVVIVGKVIQEGRVSV